MADNVIYINFLRHNRPDHQIKTSEDFVNFDAISKYITEPTEISVSNTEIRRPDLAETSLKAKVDHMQRSAAGMQRHTQKMRESATCLQNSTQQMNDACHKLSQSMEALSKAMEQLEMDRLMRQVRELTALAVAEA